MTTVLERTTATENRRLFPGTIFNIRVTAEESNNAISIADYEAISGSEPPRHVHTVEDEIFIIKEGTITFFRGDDIVEAGAGDIVFLPVNVPHHFKITSEKVKGTLIATPGNIESFFRQLSVPYEGDTIPPVTPPTDKQISYFVSLTESFGMKFV
jgi:quercetin dioxygenase-like cupin family protein